MTATEQAPLIDEFVRMMAEAKAVLLAKLDNMKMSDQDRSNLIGALTHYDQTGIAVTVFLPKNIAQRAAAGQPIERGALAQALGSGTASATKQLVLPTI